MRLYLVIDDSQVVCQYRTLAEAERHAESAAAEVRKLENVSYDRRVQVVEVVRDHRFLHSSGFWMFEDVSETGSDIDDLREYLAEAEDFLARFRTDSDAYRLGREDALREAVRQLLILRTLHVGRKGARKVLRVAADRVRALANDHSDRGTE